MCMLFVFLFQNFPTGPTQQFSELVFHWPFLAARKAGTCSLLDGHIAPQNRISILLP